MKPECKYLCTKCGGVAFYVKKREFAITGAPIMAENFQLLDGSTPIPGEYIHCRSCGVMIPELVVFQVVANDEH